MTEYWNPTRGDPGALWGGDNIVAWFQDKTQLHELLDTLGKVVWVSDVPDDQPCHSDILSAYLVWRRYKYPKGGGGHWWRREPLRGSRVVQLAAIVLCSNAGALSLPKQLELRFPQYAVCGAFRKLFPAEFTTNFQMPCVEDLVTEQI